MDSYLKLNDLQEYDSYSGDKMEISLYNDWLQPESAQQLFEFLQVNSHWTKTKVARGRRNKVIYGDPLLDGYEITYLGKKIRTHVCPWTDMPVLHKLSQILEKYTGQTYHCCVIQYYPDGISGIKPHRDKEMAPGTSITSLSLGSTRTMRFERRGFDSFDIPLSSGSLCVIHPPTNDFWLHSIPVMPTSTGPRMSLIFRNCEGMIKT
jgi:alkylated DNA repair dioxygenase AlkB